VQTAPAMARIGAALVAGEELDIAPEVRAALAPDRLI